ncbi:MAG: TIGR01459 family HAD-type hydrolase [Rhodomicrobium sp.]
MMSYGRADIPILASVAGVSENRKAWLCDVWGVLHDGETVFAPAIEACRMFKRRGGEVILVSNSPRPSEAVLDHLDLLGVPQDCFSALVTSGDVTRALVETYSGEPVFHLGPERDRCLFEGLDVEFAPAGKAVAIVCTGFFDEEHEVAEDYDGMLAAFAARSVPMICANPDLVVERGSKLLPCAGLLAERYAALGQTAVQAGKPYRPIYEAALRKLAKPLPKSEILAIGDGIDTDIKGANGQGIDSIYIASRVHLGNAVEDGAASGLLFERLFASRAFRPAAAMPHLQW